MAVIDEFYDSTRNPGKSALVSWMGAFLDERGRMNMELMAERMAEASGGDDAKLLEIEAGLREQAAKLQAAGIQAKAGKFKAAANLMGNKLGAWAKVKDSEITGATRASVATVQSQADIARNLDDIYAESRKKMEYDDTVKANLDNVVSSFKGRSATAPNDAQAIQNAVKGQMRDAQADTPERQAAIATDVMKKFRASGRGDIADMIGETILGGTSGLTEDQYLARRFNLLPPGSPEREEYLRRFSAGSMGGGRVMDMLEEDLFDNGGDDGEQSEETRTSGAVPRETDDEDVDQPRVSRSVKMKGPASAMGGMLSTLLDPSSTDAEIDAAIATQQKGIDDQIATIEAQRNRPKQPRFVGANYLLDNPNVVTDQRGRAAFDRAGARPKETAEEFESYMSMDRPRAAAAKMDVEGFNPNGSQTTVDAVAMGKGGVASVYRYYADVLRDGVPDDVDQVLKQLPSESRAILVPYVDLAKSDPAKAAEQLERLADEDPTTFHELYADEIRKASKDPKRISALVEAAEALAGDTTHGPWADAIGRVVDDFKTHRNVDTSRTALAQIADGMDAGRSDVERERRRGMAAPADPKVMREQSEADAYSKGRALGKETFDAWETSGTSLKDMQDRIGIMKTDSPMTKGMRDELTSMYATSAQAKDVEVKNLEALKGREIDTSNIGAVELPSQKNVKDYQKKKGQVEDASNAAPWDAPPTKSAPVPKSESKSEEDEDIDDDLAAFLLESQ